MPGAYTLPAVDGLESLEPQEPITTARIQPSQFSTPPDFTFGQGLPSAQDSYRRFAQEQAAQGNFNPDIGAGQSGDIFGIPGQVTSNALGDIGAPSYIRGPAAAVANVAPFVAMGPGSALARIGTAVGAGLGGYYGQQAGERLGLPETPLGNPLGIAGGIAGGVAGAKGGALAPSVARDIAENPTLGRLVTEEAGGVRTGGYEQDKINARRAAQRGGLKPMTDIQRRRAAGRAEARSSPFSYDLERVLQGRDVPEIDNQQLIRRSEIVPPDEELTALHQMAAEDAVTAKTSKAKAEVSYQMGRLRAQFEAGSILDSQPTGRALDTINEIQSRALAPPNAEARGYLDAMREIHGELAQTIDDLASGTRLPAWADIAPEPSPEAAAPASGGEQPPYQPPPPTGIVRSAQPPPPREPYVFRSPPTLSGAQSAIDAARSTNLEPGRAFGPEGSLRRKVAGAINPSVDTPLDVHIANKGRTSVRANLYGEFSRTEGTAASAIEKVWHRVPAEYVGQPNPAGGTLADYLERPSQYNATPELTAAKDALKEAQMEVLARARSEYGVDIKPYQVADPDGIYVPHVLNRDNMEQAVERTVSGLSGKPGVAKTRAYDTIADRIANDPVFAKNPELDVAKLMDIHSQSLATAASNNTFNLGVGGKTRVEVIDELHPGLRKVKEAAQLNLTRLRNQLETATKQQGQNIRGFKANAAQGRAIETRMEPLEVRIEQLGPDYGPELSHLSGQIYELRRQAAAIEDVGPKVFQSGERVANLQGQIDAAQNAVTQLVKRYQTAGVDAEKYALSPNTYRYHAPETTKAISGILQAKAPFAVEAVLNAADEGLAAGLGADFSPLTINAGLGAFSHPDVLGRRAGVILRAARSPEAMVEGLKPQDIARYEKASGRTLGQVGAEFRKEYRGLERIPKFGAALHGFNETLQRIVERGRIEAFLTDSAILQRIGKMPELQADAEAMSTLSKTVPARNPAETGRSVLRSRFERLPVISPSFISAPIELTKDYASGVAKILTGRPGQLSGRESLAILRGTTMAGSIAAISVTSSLAYAGSHGKTPESAIKDVLNPGSPHFASLILPNGGSIGLGGPFRSFIRAVAPGYDKDGNFRMFAGGNPLSFAQAKLNLQLGTAIDLTKNKDYYGNKLYWGGPTKQAQLIAQYVAENSNLIAGAVLEPQRTGRNADLGHVGVQVASQLAGTNYREPTAEPVIDRRNKEAQKQGLKDYASATKEQKQKINDELGTNFEPGATRTARTVDMANQILEKYGDERGTYIAYGNFYRSLNESKQSRQAWEDSQDLIRKYEAITSDARLDQVAQAKYKKAFKDLTQGQKNEVTGDIHSAYREQRPELDAWLAYWGANDSVKTQEAGRLYEEFLKRYTKTGKGPAVKLSK